MHGAERSANIHRPKGGFLTNIGGGNINAIPGIVDFTILVSLPK